MSLTCVSGGYPRLGTNSRVLPLVRQVPAIDGDRVGSGEPAASGCEKTTRIGAAPSIRRACEAGVTDSTLSGPDDARAARRAARFWAPWPAPPSLPLPPRPPPRAHPTPTPPPTRA